MSNQADRNFLDIIESETQSKSTVKTYFREVKNKWEDDVAEKLDPVTRHVLYTAPTCLAVMPTLTIQVEEIYMLTSSKFENTTGHILPVDGGLKEAFLR